MGIVLHLHDVAVSAGRHKAEEGRLQLRVGQVEGAMWPRRWWTGTSGLPAE